MQPFPDLPPDRLLALLRGMAAPGELVALEETFRGPPLPAQAGEGATKAMAAARVLAASLHLETGPAVDFWTEASLFSQAGLTALVYGPGDIAQAHTADEFVTLEQLQRYAGTITRLLQNNMSGTTTP